MLAIALLVSVGRAGAQTTLTAAGSSAAAIQAQVDAFRAALGPLNANVAGSFGSGRREINWDGVPDMDVTRFDGHVVYAARAI